MYLYAFIFRFVVVVVVVVSVAAVSAPLLSLLVSVNFFFLFWALFEFSSYVKKLIISIFFRMLIEWLTRCLFYVLEYVG